MMMLSWKTMKIAGLKFQLSDTIGTVPFVHRKGNSYMTVGTGTVSLHNITAIVKKRTFFARKQC